jgi:hypothetical protein
MFRISKFRNFELEAASGRADGRFAGARMTQVNGSLSSRQRPEQSDRRWPYLTANPHHAFRQPSLILVWLH